MQLAKIKRVMTIRTGESLIGILSGVPIFNACSYGPCKLGRLQAAGRIYEMQEAAASLWECRDKVKLFTEGQKNFKYQGNRRLVKELF